MVARFVRATGGDLKLSAKRLDDTARWRQQVHPEMVTCTACIADPHSHYMHIVGHDLRQRPVIYSCLELAKDRTVEHNMNHMIQTFELSIRLMPDGVEQWVWFSDLHGFGLRDMAPGIGRAFSTLAGAHYPERLACFLLVDPPTVFKQLWNLLLPLLDPKTKTKLRVVPYDVSNGKKSRLLAAMNELFGKELQTWLLEEMKANRKKAIKKVKTYSQADLASFARQQSPEW